MVMLMQKDPGLESRRALAQAMMQKGLQTGQPIRHWTQGAAKLANALLGAKMGRDIEQEQQTRQKDFQQNLLNAIQGEGGQFGPEQDLMTRLGNVEGIDQNQLAGFQLQQAMQPKPRDPLADYEAKKRIDQNYAVPDGAKPTEDQRNYEKWIELKNNPDVSKDEADAFAYSANLKTPPPPNLPAHLQKRYSTAADEAIESGRNSEEFSILADDLEKMDFGGGLFSGKWGEAYKDVTGNQDAVTQLKRKYFGIRSSQAVKNLPPGVASDKDIALALKGFPGENESAENIASFMRGMAKLEGKRAEYAEFRANYLTENREELGLLKAWNNRDKEAVDWSDL